MSTERCLVVVEGTVDRKRKANWIGHILCRNCLLQQVIEGKMKGADRSGKKTRKKA